MARISPEEWQPAGVEGLEDNAWHTVKSEQNSAVIAGPGAGKTELLAQKACYLLETGICPYPKRILAISFKRDAAKNLRERVSIRVPKEAARFDSLTFDAFSKGVLDRFSRSLPSPWKIHPDYEVALFKRRDWDDFVRGLNVPAEFGNSNILHQTRWDDFYKYYVLGEPLPLIGFEPTSTLEWAAAEWWRRWLNNLGETRLGFPMIGRLVELLLRTNPLILKAIRATYSHVFLDEFQDTTHVQYGLVKTAFAVPTCRLTAVGDHKQQIMRWAMALDDPFGLFCDDFGAEVVPLIRNYRSSPELVRIQDRIARIVDPNPQETQAMQEDSIWEESCSVMEFRNRQHEAEHIASIVNGYIEDYDLSPRDFVVLVKQTTDQFSPPLIRAFEAAGLKARDESLLQDLLTENLTTIILSYFKLAANAENKGQAWRNCLDITALLKGLDPNEDSILPLQEKIGDLVRQLATSFDHVPNNNGDVADLVRVVTDFLGEGYIKSFYPEYRRGDWYDKVKEDLITNLFEQFEVATTWGEAIAYLEGEDAVPIMTIHKSKGLEFHTVFFVGLEDESWWSFRIDPAESRSAFFVAFSRARQRAIFTYCANNQRAEVNSLYQVLEDAGVPQVIVP
ncbi:UvrD-helicase domain-containing protein [Pseudodesulfovibrio sp.]|uniref:UvrD-helicase domain-containing protein n=1 Tax=unclassified Pseudodesulfovibrio TaxID=2661612 RepID=UPI003B000887